VIVLLDLHFGLRRLRGDTKADCHTMQYGSVDDGDGNPSRNEALLHKNRQRGKVHLG
jgi:hypothetical protein